MKLYDVKCPICGKLNKGLILDETEGWFVCDKCGSETRDMSFEELVPIPLLTEKDLIKLAKNR